MRILNVNATLDPVWGGGGAERTRRLSSALARLGHAVTVLTNSVWKGASDLPRVEGAEVVALRCLNKRFMIPLLPLRRLRQLIRAHDIVHLTGHWTTLNAVIYLLTRLERKPYAVSPVGTLPLFGRSRKLKRIYNAVVGHSLIRNAQAHIAVTSSEVHQFGDYGVELSKVTVIPNGVDAESFAAIDSKLFRERHALANAPLILFMGRLNSIKGPDLLLDAFAQVAERFSSYLLVFAGPDEGMEASLRKTALRHGISDRVRFVGYVGGDEKIAAYRAATLLVIPSRMEAMSIVVLEGGAAGVPVLITDQCGFDMVEEIGGGRVVKAEATALAEGLEAMLSDAANLANTGQRLCNLVRRDFTWDAAALRLSALFEAVLVQRRG
jgi:glycosyltransferase involved in cell wall biosynthesis